METNAATSTSADSSTTLQVTPEDKFTESDIGELVSLGFTRDKVIYELRHFAGDKIKATAALFAKSLKF